METVITAEDMDHMSAFPVDKKAKVMREIMSKTPTEEQVFEGSNNYTKIISRIRADGLRLIDLQLMETAFTSVWYGKNGGLLNRNKSEAVALVVWESNGNDDDITTVRLWHLRAVAANESTENTALGTRALATSPR